MEIGKTKKDLKNVLLYAQELLSFNDNIVYDIANDRHPFFYEHQITGLEGVEANVDPETWLRVRRLHENPPPMHDPMFEGWASFGQHASPDRQPKFLTERMLRLPIEEISELMEAGLVVSPDDVMRPLNSDQAHPQELDVILRLDGMPEFRALWQAYLDGPWAKWVAFERPRRRSIEFYNKLYQIHQRVLSLGDDNPIELVFGVGMARWKIKNTRVNIPIFEQLVELVLLEDGTILMQPRTTEPQLNLRPFHSLEIEGSKSIQRDAGQQFDRMLDDPDVGFSPFDASTFEWGLRMCAARLSPTGAYLPDERKDHSDRSLPDATDTLSISDTWTVFVRQRSEDFRKDDIQRLIQRVEEAEEEEDLPPPGVSFVEEPSDEKTYDDGEGLDISERTLDLPETARGWNGPSGGGGDTSGSAKREETWFFPLPYNDDQVEIIRRLEDDKTDGVLVQGPPGTGKTHTIANIICHYLATKRRVLVTAKTPEALNALQEKIPEGIRALAIAVIHNDREGARQLEQAVNLLANEAKQINQKAVSQEITEKQARLAELRSAVRDIDRELYAYAEKNLQKVSHGDEAILPMELARKIADDRAAHGWFIDPLTLAPKFDPQFTDDEIQEIADLRRLIGADLIYRVDDIPAPPSLPDMARLVAAHGELTRISKIDGRSDAGEIPYIAIEAVGLESAQEMRDWLEEHTSLLEEVSAEPWLLSVFHTVAGIKRSEQGVTAALHGILEDWAGFHLQGRNFSLKAIAVVNVPPVDPSFDRALDDLVAGKQPFGIFGLFKGGLKARIESVRIEGRQPSSPEDWQVVREYRCWRRDAESFLGRWSAIARIVGAPGLEQDWDAAENDFHRWGRLVARLIAVLPEIDARRKVLRRMFPYGVDVDDVVYSGRCSLALEALADNLEKAELVDAQATKAELAAIVGDRALPWHTAVQGVAENLGGADVPQSAVVEAWKQVVAEARRLDGLRETIRRLDALTAKVAASGAPVWASRLRNEIGGNVICERDTWKESWRWARADGHIRSLVDRERIARLSDLRAAADLEQKKLFADVVRLRTFLGLKQNLTAKVEAALAKFASAVARLGKGTGKAAGRHRRIIRSSTLDTAQAVPCWILPEWRVAEQLPAELGVFDLVVIDEASQSDITALPAILRGRKVLIVGDDKQVSPMTVGIEERKIIQLRTTFLLGLPFADQMDPATSLYELGGMVFPGKAIMLREHFRCVEPIIRFSSRFYPKPLIPLRIPTATERLDPPLIDIYVPHGAKSGDVNAAEAEIIVSEIAKLVADPEFRKRSIGVISLIGDKQAKLIYDRLMREIGAEDVERHRIMCGNASTYQGQERDIVFLSMVSCPKTAMAQTSRVFEQRFNVAMSRARDRLILVRSVAASHLKPGDLKLAVIEHFRNPMEGGNVSQSKEIMDLCESGFERDFAKHLLEMGYRIRPQVPVGDRRIDFVIEGHQDRRLAIELDGDKYHGPERWAEDVRRQKALERLGWTFWRCWGSNWIADPDGCVSDLKVVLNRLGIDPIGSAPIYAVHTKHLTAPNPRTVDSAAPVAKHATLDHPIASTAPTPHAHEAADDATPTPKELAESDFPDYGAFLTAKAGQILRQRPAQQTQPERQTPEVAVQGPPAQPPVARPVAHRDMADDEDSGSETVEVGDVVVIRFNDTPERPLRITLSLHENRPAEGVVHVGEPLGIAVLGAATEDEIEVVVGGRARTALVEKIEKAPKSAGGPEVSPRMVEPTQLKVQPRLDFAPSREPPTLTAARSVGVGCDLGDGAVLLPGEQIFCHLHKRDVEWRKADGVAIARDGTLFLDDRRVIPQRAGALLQAALRIVQERTGDVSETSGDAKSLNAWLHWFVRRDGRLIPVGELRTVVRTRNRGGRAEDGRRDLTFEDVDL